jgi:hypothetical protein
VKRLLGGIVMAVGILIMTGSGLCSLAVMGGAAWNGGGSTGVLPFVLIIGGIPFAIGFGLFRLGRWIMRPPLPSPAEQAKPFE